MMWGGRKGGGRAFRTKCKREAMAFESAALGAGL